MYLAHIIIIIITSMSDLQPSTAITIYESTAWPISFYTN